ncbi:MAG: D-2-hydroxyacid dehydrogenase [Gammaproteobacteria bacterium]|nr:D-2-hydroxyacid dehydrogenase [Gammaproteobacteria bacterium]
MKAVFLDTDTLGPQDIDLDPLTNLLPCLECFPSTQAKDLVTRIADAEILLTNKVVLNESALRQAQKLKLICLAATGTDNIALDYAQQAGITVCNIRDYCTPSVVQHVFALILSLTQRLYKYREALANNAWAECEQFSLLEYPIRELSGKTMGIIGYGTLGQAVAAVAHSFGMNVITAKQPYLLTDESIVDVNANTPQKVSLHQLLSQADIVSLHCPLTPDTENLIDAAAIELMRTEAILINTARGGLIDSQALVTALKENGLAGAGIDVLREEPPLNPEPLLDTRLANLIVTPHIAWAAIEARQRAVTEMAKNIASFLDGSPRHTCQNEY